MCRTNQLLWENQIIRKLLQSAIDKIHELRHNPAFKVSSRLFVIFLMVLGAWVATRDLDIPLGFANADKFKHAVVFMGFSFLLDLSTSRQPFWLWKASPLIVYGLTIEILQYFTPVRTFSLWDWMADISGILLYFFIKMIVYQILAKNSINKQY